MLQKGQRDNGKNKNHTHFELPFNINIALFANWGNHKRYTSDTFSQINYQDRVYEDYYLYFKRFGFSIGYRF